MTPNDDRVSPVEKLITDWLTARAEIQAIERAEHPDIIDRFGRAWRWKCKDLYVHCGSVDTPDMIDMYALPTQFALDNPNYDLCDICIDGRDRLIRLCQPEWYPDGECPHAVCARLRRGEKP